MGAKYFSGLGDPVNTFSSPQSRRPDVASGEGCSADSGMFSGGSL